MRKNSGRYGINMKRWCREHESAVSALLAAGGETRQALEDHLEKIRWLQHERLVHLIVTVMTVMAELLAVWLTLTMPELAPFSAAVVLLLAVLLGFYFYHYFFLENAVQRWYKLAERMMESPHVREKETERK
jgi:hypothetical protein